MDYSIVIPTNRSSSSIQPLLLSLIQQTLLPRQIVIVYDCPHLTEDMKNQYHTDLKNIFSDYPLIQVDIIDMLSTPSFIPWQWASYVRNFWRSYVSSPYMIFVDDDNIFDTSACEDLLSYRTSDPHSQAIIAPLQWDHASTTIRPSLAIWFQALLCRPQWLSHRHITITQRYHRLLLASSNCLVWPTMIFQQFPFDESIPFVYEDLILTAQMTQWGISVVCDTKVLIHHYHAHRSKLAELYINTAQRAYYKAKHRIILASIITSGLQKVLFYAFWLRWHTCYLMICIVWYAPYSEWKWLLWWIIRGTRDGLLLR